MRERDFVGGKKVKREIENSIREIKTEKECVRERNNERESEKG